MVFQQRNMYAGTFESNRKPVVTVAPDTIIYINGRRVVDVCRDCNTEFEVDSHATSVQTSLSIDGPGGGTATVTLQIPRNSNFPFIQDGRPLIPNMSEIEIFFKGYFLVNGLPRYYPSFWGIVTSYTYSYSGGVHTYSLSCKDILHWWNITRYNFSPAAISTVFDSRTQMTAFKNIFANKTPMQIIIELARQTFGQGLVPAITSANRNSQLVETAPETIRATIRSITSHWVQRQSQITRALRFFGADGGLIYENAEYVDNFCKKRADADRAFSQIQTTPSITGTNLDIGLSLSSDFNPFFELGNVQAYESDANFSSKLDVAVAVKDWIGFEFFLDTSGEIVFKPPFYNIDVRPNFPVSWIRDTDILSWNFAEEEPEYTRIEVKGGFSRILESGGPEARTAYHTDYNLARQYGLRSTSIDRNWIRSVDAAFLHGVTELDRVTTRRFTATVDIIGRPELRLGYPVYIESQDAFWYVTDISHGFSYGGQFTTSLGMTARRIKLADPTYRFVASEAGQQTVDQSGVARDSNGKNVGIKNAVLRLTRDPREIAAALNAQENAFQSVLGAAAEEDGVTYTTENDLDPQGYVAPVAEPKQHLRHANDLQQNRTAETPAGLYVPDVNPFVKGLVIKYKKNDVEKVILGGNTAEQIDSIKGAFRIPDADKLGIESTLSVLPVSDENGYEVVGAFPYGRQFQLNQDGTLLPSSEDSENARDFQLIAPSQSEIDEPNLEDIRDTRSLAADRTSNAGVFQIDQTQTGLVFAELQPDRHLNRGCLCKSQNQEFDLEYLRAQFSGLFDPEENVNPQDILGTPQVDVTGQLQQEVNVQTDPLTVSPTAADVGGGGGGNN